MTDPRIEAVVIQLFGYERIGNKFVFEEVKEALKAADEASWRPIDTAPDGDIWMRNGNIIALVNKRTAHGAMSYLGWGYVYSPTHWMYPQSLPKEGA